MGALSYDCEPGGSQSAYDRVFGLLDRDLATAGVLGEDLFEHPLQVEIHVLHTDAADHDGRGFGFDRDFDRLADELQTGIAEQGAREKSTFAEDLKAIANAHD